MPVRRARSVRAWLAERRAGIEVFHLAPYSPDLNPDEGLNADLKQAVTRKAPARGKPQLKRAVVGHMRKLRSRRRGSWASSATTHSATPPDPRPPRSDQ